MYLKNHILHDTSNFINGNISKMLRHIIKFHHEDKLFMSFTLKTFVV